jgi:hypothetical protein
VLLSMLSLVEASMLPSHYCVPAIIEGVFLPRDSIPRIGIRSRQKWERISSTPFQCLYCAVYVLSCCGGHVVLDEAFA